MKTFESLALALALVTATFSTVEFFSGAIAAPMMIASWFTAITLVYIDFKA